MLVGFAHGPLYRNHPKFEIRGTSKAAKHDRAASVCEPDTEKARQANGRTPWGLAGGGGVSGPKHNEPQSVHKEGPPEHQGRTQTQKFNDRKSRTSKQKETETWKMFTGLGSTL